MRLGDIRLFILSTIYKDDLTERWTLSHRREWCSASDWMRYAMYDAAVLAMGRSVARVTVLGYNDKGESMYIGSVYGDAAGYGDADYECLSEISVERARMQAEALLTQSGGISPAE